MANLIITIICIALTAVVAGMGLNYINTEHFFGKKNYLKIEADFNNLKASYDVYVIAKNTKPSVANWQDDLRSVRTNINTSTDIIPQDLFGFTWSYNIVNQKPYFCLSGNFDNVVYEGMKETQKFLSSKPVYINSSCGLRSNADISSGNLAITYWM